MYNAKTTLIHIDRWRNAKYITWSVSRANPFVRIPLPSGNYTTKSVKRCDNELDTLAQCIEVRDKIGERVWGKKQWNHMLRVPERTVSRFQTTPVSPKNGVHHYTRKCGTCVWVAIWYVPIFDSDGNNTSKRKIRAKWYSYGTRNTDFKTSPEAFIAACNKLSREDIRWYTAIHGKK